ncbi:MALE GAMETOPHYTE DEFECTIVE 2 [Artemisia annua]|uniref:MALE GAMETOPHYTE DEFECTIVE 2 n=1 Tax=Artemisia annua TaxID=35608 RepID=A0A2U1NX60_ARTAN|nr:MALE GAMETOPHYTE DEFECTIVE 2 [Artemisia annua]
MPHTSMPRECKKLEKRKKFFTKLMTNQISNADEFAKLSCDVLISTPLRLKSSVTKRKLDLSSIYQLLSLWSLEKILLRGAKDCSNRTLCEEHLNSIFPAPPPFYPRQFVKCVVVGNSNDLLKTEFGEEIDSHDVVIRDNEAPVNEVNYSPQRCLQAFNRLFS